MKEGDDRQAVNCPYDRGGNRPEKESIVKNETDGYNKEKHVSADCETYHCRTQQIYLKDYDIGSPLLKLAIKRNMIQLKRKKRKVVMKNVR